MDTVNYYGRNAKRYLKYFDLVARSAIPVVERYFPGENADELMGETRQQYKSLLPGLPYIGGKQPFTLFVVFTGMLLALHRTNQAQGGTVEKTGELMYEVAEVFLNRLSPLVKRLMAAMNFSPIYLKRLQKRAAESHERKYPGDYVYDFIPGDGTTFNYGVDYHECGSCKYLDSQGVFELAQYLCPVDILYSQVFQWGLSRTKTIASGGEKCDFRFRRGGAINVVVPASMQAVVERHR
jgi:hypothetical protein